MGHQNSSTADGDVWAPVTADDRSSLVFIGRRVKINAEYYRENVLKTVLKPWADKYFDRRPLVFQQAQHHSAEGARVNQEWLKKATKITESQSI